MKIVLAGDYGNQNLGDQGMLVVLRERLVEQLETEITVLSRRPSARYEKQYRVRTIADLSHPDGERPKKRWFYGLNRGDSTEHLDAIVEAVREADLLVLGGGRIFFDYGLGFMRGDLAYFVQLVTLARWLGTPVMLFGMTIVPMGSESAQEHLRFIVENAEIITVRENQSRENLRAMGIDGERVHVLPDPALGLPFLEPDVSYGGRKGSEWLAEGDERLRALEMEPVRPIVGVNVRSYLWRDGEVGERRMEERLAELLDRVVEELGAQLLFIPQKTAADGDPEQDDRVMSRRIVAGMRQARHCYAIEDELSMWEALAVYRWSSMLISMRRHGVIFALSQRVPVVAVSMDPNLEFLMANLGIKDDTASLAPARLERSVETARRVLRGDAERHAMVYAHVEECAARTRAYVDLMRELLSI